MNARSIWRGARNWRSHPLNRDEHATPFFIVGAGRSGSTLLRRILYANPALYIPPETHVLGEAITLYRRNRHWSWPHLVRLVLAQFEFQRDFGAFDLSLRTLAQRLDTTPPDKRSCAFMIDRLYRTHARVHSAELTRWGDKSPYNSFHLDAIHRTFPDAQFIHLVRDGCDVVYSMLDSGLFDDAESAARRWVDSVAAVGRFARRHPSEVIEVRYEQLVSRPAEVIEDLCNFLDVDPVEEMLHSEFVAVSMGDVPLRAHHRRAWEPVSPSSVGLGRRELPREDRRRIAPIVDTVLERMGYPRC
jgi:protein-tyrosine sulfotransferase